MKFALLFGLLIVVSYIGAICGENDEPVSDESDKQMAGMNMRFKRGLCFMTCSCGWGSCCYNPGYAGSSCCAQNYALVCCKICYHKQDFYIITK